MQRLNYRRKNTYNTKSNQTKVTKTPGGRLILHQRTKTSSGVKCADCKVVLNGIKRVRPSTFRLLKKSNRTVARAYGGNRCHKCVTDKIMRAFLNEEEKALKAIAAEKAKLAKNTAPVEKTKTTTTKKAKKSKTSKK